MKRIFSLLLLSTLCISSYAWDVSVSVDAKAKKKWHVTTGTAENCKSGNGICFIITGKIESIKISETALTYQEGSDVITLSVPEGSNFFEEMDNTKTLEITEDSPVLVELNQALGLPDNSTIAAGRYIPTYRNGRYYYTLNLNS